MIKENIKELQTIYDNAKSFYKRAQVKTFCVVVNCF